MFEVSEEVTFSSAHRLLNYEGKCEKLHGHNWRVRIFVRTTSMDEAGISFDFGDLRKKLEEVTEPLDHSVLNDLPFFEGLSPSAENIAIYIFREMRERIPVHIHRVEVWENNHSCVTYYPEGV